MEIISIDLWELSETSIRILDFQKTQKMLLFLYILIYDDNVKILNGENFIFSGTIIISKHNIEFHKCNINCNVITYVSISNDSSFCTWTSLLGIRSALNPRLLRFIAWSITEKKNSQES